MLGRQGSPESVDLNASTQTKAYKITPPNSLDDRSFLLRNMSSTAPSMSAKLLVSLVNHQAGVIQTAGNRVF